MESVCLPHFCTQEFPKKEAGPWMSNIPGDKLISELTIPGTHDSGCRVNIEFAKTQTWSISSQLKGGVRFFDIRCRNYFDTFAIHHDFLWCGIMFGDVLNDCSDFLKANPGECIIMRIKEEYEPQHCNRSFEDTFTEYCKVYENLISMTDNFPRLEEIRGKVWVIRQFSYDKGYYWDRSEIQDDYMLDNPTNIKRKEEEIEEHLKKAINGSKNELYINFCSGTGVFCFPSVVAKFTNAVPMNYTGRFGIVIMDYPGEDTIQHLIDQNSFK